MFFCAKPVFRKNMLLVRTNLGALLLCPCLFRPSDKVWRSRRADAPRCAHFSTVISPSWITEQISVGKSRTEACQCIGSAKQVSKLSLGQNKQGQNITTPPDWSIEELCLFQGKSVSVSIVLFGKCITSFTQQQMFLPGLYLYL